jgi:hypothetical protein
MAYTFKLIGDLMYFSRKSGTSNGEEYVKLIWEKYTL